VTVSCLLFLSGVIVFLIHKGNNPPIPEEQDLRASRPAAQAPKASQPTGKRPPAPEDMVQPADRQDVLRGAKKTNRSPRPTERPHARPAPPLAPLGQAQVPLSDEEVNKQLLEVPELDSYPLVAKLRKTIDQELEGKLQRLGRQEPPSNEVKRVVAEAGRVKFNQNVNVPVLAEAQRQGLPVQTLPSSKVSFSTATSMQKLSTAIRTQRFVTIPGMLMDSAAVAKFREWLKTNPIDHNLGTRRILLQMLQVEAREERLILIEELARGNDSDSAKALARRALFDPSRAVRAAAIEALKKRPAADYRDVLLDGLRYPWAPVAGRAAEALVRLKDSGVVPSLVEMLDRPDPSLPVFDAGKKQHLVRELVRVNHLRNCYLCHGAAPVLESPIGGRVPPVGKPLGKLYYEEMAGDFVRADITFLRQDFSLSQPVKDAAPWPDRQRFDFLVRQRAATKAEIARLQQPPASYPQREALISALRKLTGKDYSLKRDERKPGPRTVPPDTKPNPVPGARKSLPAELAALGVGPRAKPHVKATSPDGKSQAVVAGNEVVVGPVGSPEKGFRLVGHKYQVTSVWWALDGKTIVTDDLEGQVIKYDATSGKQILAFYKP
jgi:hypothetical protein